jgi:hypothetical protein
MRRVELKVSEFGVKLQQQAIDDKAIFKTSLEDVITEYTKAWLYLRRDARFKADPANEHQRIKDVRNLTNHINQIVNAEDLALAVDQYINSSDNFKGFAHWSPLRAGLNKALRNGRAKYNLTQLDQMSLLGTPVTDESLFTDTGSSPENRSANSNGSNDDIFEAVNNTIPAVSTAPVQLPKPSAFVAPVQAPVMVNNAEMQQRLKQVEQELQLAKAQVTAKNADIVVLKKHVATRDGMIADQENELNALTQRVQQAEQKVQGLQVALKDKVAENKLLKTRVSDSAKLIAEQNSMIDTKNNELEDLSVAMEKSEEKATKLISAYVQILAKVTQLLISVLPTFAKGRAEISKQLKSAKKLNQANVGKASSKSKMVLKKGEDTKFAKLLLEQTDEDGTNIADPFADFTAQMDVNRYKRASVAIDVKNNVAIEGSDDALSNSSDDDIIAALMQDSTNESLQTQVNADYKARLAALPQASMSQGADFVGDNSTFSPPPPPPAFPAAAGGSMMAPPPPPPPPMSNGVAKAYTPLKKSDSKQAVQPKPAISSSDAIFAELKAGKALKDSSKQSPLAPVPAAAKTDHASVLAAKLKERAKQREKSAEEVQQLEAKFAEDKKKKSSGVADSNPLAALLASSLLKINAANRDSDDEADNEFDDSKQSSLKK